MASFENYNLPYNYTTAVTLTKTLSILVSVNFLTCGWIPNSCFFPRLKIFCGLLLQIVIPHYLCKGKRDSIKEPIRTFRAKYSILENKTRKCMRTHIHVPQTQTSLTFLIAKNILLLKQRSRSRKFSTIILLEVLIYHDIYRKSLTGHTQAYSVKRTTFSFHTNFLNHHTHPI